MLTQTLTSAAAPAIREKQIGVREKKVSWAEQLVAVLLMFLRLLVWVSVLLVPWETVE